MSLRLWRGGRPRRGIAGVVDTCRSIGPGPGQDRILPARPRAASRTRAIRALRRRADRVGKVAPVAAHARPGGEPPTGAVVRRQAGRVLVVDAAGRVLLLHGFDPARPGEPYWFTVGGGAEPQESLAEAAVRELAEETGIAARPADLGEPVWHEVAEFSFQGASYRQEQDFFLLEVGSPEISADGRDQEEAAVIDGHRWWTLAELDATAERYYPAALPRLLRSLGIGQRGR